MTANAETIITLVFRVAESEGGLEMGSKSGEEERDGSRVRSKSFALPSLLKLHPIT